VGSCAQSNCEARRSVFRSPERTLTIDDSDVTTYNGLGFGEPRSRHQPSMFMVISCEQSKHARRLAVVVTSLDGAAVRKVPLIAYGGTHLPQIADSIHTVDRLGPRVISLLNMQGDMLAREVHLLLQIDHCTTTHTMLLFVTWTETRCRSCNDCSRWNTGLSSGMPKRLRGSFEAFCRRNTVAARWHTFLFSLHQP
jgi:hypothetical protein